MIQESLYYICDTMCVNSCAMKVIEVTQMIHTDILHHTPFPLSTIHKTLTCKPGTPTKLPKSLPPKVPQRPGVAGRI